MDELSTFSALTDYKSPAVPTTKLVKKYWQKATQLLRPKDDTPYIPSDELAHAGEQALRHFFPAPRYALIGRELDATLKGHLDSKRPHPRFWLCLPEGDPGVLHNWAEHHNYQLLSPPPRTQLMADTGSIKLAHQGGVLVVPQLERWFLRHPEGVAVLRSLLAKLEAHEGPVVLSANGFALVFLQQLLDRSTLMSKCITFKPFTTDRLYRWLYRNIYDGKERTFLIKDSFSGKALFGPTVDEAIPFRGLFNRLAADSRGIPWVAWQLLISALKTRKQVDEESGESVRDSSAGLWMHAPPARREQVLSGKNARFILHALALHGGLTEEHLRLVTPCSLDSLADLYLEGFVTRDDEHGYRLNPLAYAPIMQALRSAGMYCPPL